MRRRMAEATNVVALTSKSGPMDKNRWPKFKSVPFRPVSELTYYGLSVAFYTVSFIILALFTNIQREETGMKQKKHI